MIGRGAANAGGERQDSIQVQGFPDDERAPHLRVNPAMDRCRSNGVHGEQPLAAGVCLEQAAASRIAGAVDTSTTLDMFFPQFICPRPDVHGAPGRSRARAPIK